MACPVWPLACDWMLSGRVLVNPGQNYAQNPNSFTLQILMCRYSHNVLGVFSLVVQIQMKKLTTAGKKMYLSIVLQFYPAHSEAFFIVTNVRLSDCFTSFVCLVTSVLRRIRPYWQLCNSCLEFLCRYPRCCGRPQPEHCSSSQDDSDCFRIHVHIPGDCQSAVEYFQVGRTSLLSPRMDEVLCSYMNRCCNPSSLMKLLNSPLISDRSPWLLHWAAPALSFLAA